jgi:hypothetical protein
VSDTKQKPFALLSAGIVKTKIEKCTERFEKHPSYKDNEVNVMMKPQDCRSLATVYD